RVSLAHIYLKYRHRKKKSPLVRATLMSVLGVSCLLVAPLLAATETATAPATPGEVAAEAKEGEESATAQPEAPKFDILEYQVEGTTVLPVLQVEKAVYSYPGEGKTIKDLEGARDALEKVYQAAGYFTVRVDIPEGRERCGSPSSGRRAGRACTRDG